MFNSANSEIRVFISYAREDKEEAERLYEELKGAGLNPWLDKKDIRGGQNWRIAIKKGIKTSRYFIPLFSSQSVEKIGYVQKESKYALDNLDRFPESKIYVIPIRLDECEIPYDKLEDIQYVDMFPNWRAGVEEILTSIENDSEVDSKYPKIKGKQTSSSTKKEGGSTTTQDTAKGIKRLTTFRGEKSFFVGRKEYINKEIKKYLRAPGSRLAIVGPGGSGKSQLAFKAIRQYHEKEGIFDTVIPVYFDIGLMSFDEFLSKMAEKIDTIQKSEFEKNEDIEQRKGIIKDALNEKAQPLIYADNFETVSLIINDARAKGQEKLHDAQQIKNFLNNDLPENTSVLLTSRELSNLGGKEKRIELEGLTQEESKEMFSMIVEEDYLKNPTTQRIRQKIDNLLDKTGGHPLLIEVVGSNIKSEDDIEEVSTSLGHKINRNQPDKRLESLKASFDYTLSKVETNVKDLLQKFTFFKSPFPISAAEEIFGANRTDITYLYSRSLLARIESDEVYGEIEDPEYYAYKFHPATRNYVEGEIIQPGDRNFFDNLEKEYGVRFSEYYNNLLVHIGEAFGKENHSISLALFNIIFQSENNDFDRAIELSKSKDPVLESDILVGLGSILTKIGMHSKSLEYNMRCLDIDIGELKDRKKEAEDYNNIGVSLQNLGRYDEALEYHRKSLTLYEQLNDREAMAWGYSGISRCLQAKGEYDEALSNEEKCLAISKELLPKEQHVMDYGNMAGILLNLGRYEEALQHFTQALDIAKELGNRDSIARCHLNIADALSLISSNYEKALEHCETASTYYEKLNDKANLAYSYRLMGDLLMKVLRHRDALRYYEKELAVHTEESDRLAKAGHYEEENNRLNTSAVYAQIGVVHAQIGVVHEETGEYDKALEYHVKALAIDKELNNKEAIARDYYNMSFVYGYKMNKEEETKCLLMARNILQEFEKKAGYRHPLMEDINEQILYTEKTKSV